MDDWKYSHNLNILIVDENNITIENKSLLQSIYDEFVNKNIFKKVEVFNEKYIIKLYWEKVDIQSKIFNYAPYFRDTNYTFGSISSHHFFSDLFIISAYSDNILHETTKKILYEIENKLKIETENKNWKIIFYISKLLENMNTKVIID